MIFASSAGTDNGIFTMATYGDGFDVSSENVACRQRKAAFWTIRLQKGMTPREKIA
jgi:hypothetical protein